MLRILIITNLASLLLAIFYIGLFNAALRDWGRSMELLKQIREEYQGLIDEIDKIMLDDTD